MTTALVAGASGLVGKALLEKLLSEDYYDQVKSIARHTLPINHSKLRQVIIDFDEMHQAADELHADDVYCCLGTTIKKAGSQEAFRKVDFDYPVALAKIALQQGAKQFLLVSALGSDKNSSIFYNKVKGDTEEEIMAVGFQTVHIFRPSLLLGNRIEKRRGEKLLIGVARILRPVLPKKYRGIEVTKVAAAMVKNARLRDSGIFYHDSAEMQTA